jgi:hypothetical protein
MCVWQCSGRDRVNAGVVAPQLVWCSNNPVFLSSAFTGVEQTVFSDINIPRYTRHVDVNVDMAWCREKSPSALAPIELHLQMQTFGECCLPRLAG